MFRFYSDKPFNFNLYGRQVAVGHNLGLPNQFVVVIGIVGPIEKDLCPRKRLPTKGMRQRLVAASFGIDQASP